MRKEPLCGILKAQFLLILPRYYGLKLVFYLGPPIISLFAQRWEILIKFFFLKIEGAVESLSREILILQAKGDKEAAGLLLQKYSVLSEPLKVALKKLETIQV